jgi:hypothetical protein
MALVHGSLGATPDNVAGAQRAGKILILFQLWGIALIELIVTALATAMTPRCRRSVAARGRSFGFAEDLRFLLTKR